MIHLVLYQPEIPPNTGNAMRLAANIGATLHLIEPLGFELTDARLRRAGLDYRDRATVVVHPDLAHFRAGHAGRVIAFSRHATDGYADVRYEDTDALLFGPESTGLDPALIASDAIDMTVRLPMVPNVRSLNLSNAVAVAAYEAWRQRGFPGAAESG